MSEFHCPSAWQIKVPIALASNFTGTPSESARSAIRAIAPQTRLEATLLWPLQGLGKQDQTLSKCLQGIVQILRSRSLSQFIKGGFPAISCRQGIINTSYKVCREGCSFPAHVIRCICYTLAALACWAPPLINWRIERIPMIFNRILWPRFQD